MERAAPRMMVADASTLGVVAGWPQRCKTVPHWYQFGESAGPGFTPFDSLYGAAGARRRGRRVAGRPVRRHLHRGGRRDPARRGADPRQRRRRQPDRHGLPRLDARRITTSSRSRSSTSPRSAWPWPTCTPAAPACWCRASTRRRPCGSSTATASPTSRISLPCCTSLLDAAGKLGSRLPSLKHVSGLDSPQTIQRLHESTGAQFWTGFGQSETSGFVSLQRVSERPGAAGKPAPLCQVRLVDDYDREVPVGTPGRDHRPRPARLPGLLRPARRDGVHLPQRLAPHRRRGALRRRRLPLLRQAQAREGADQARRRERVPRGGRDGHHADGGRERGMRLRHPRRQVGRGDQGRRRGEGRRPLHRRAGQRLRGVEDRPLQAPPRGGVRRRPRALGRRRRGPRAVKAKWGSGA